MKLFISVLFACFVFNIQAQTREATCEGKTVEEFTAMLQENILPFNEFYPITAIINNLEGTYTYRFTIDKTGKVYRDNTNVFTQTLADVVEMCDWEPAYENNTPVTKEYSMTFTYKHPGKKLTKRDVELIKNHRVIPYAEIEDKPQYMHMDAISFTSWIDVKHSSDYQVVSFVINPNKTISDIHFEKEYNAHIAEIIKFSETYWKPGKHNGVKARVLFKIPVLLKDKNIEIEEDVQEAELTIHKAEKTDDNNEFPFTIVDEQPLFQNSGAEEFSRWLMQHVIYPEEAQENNIQAKIVVSFTINKDGTLSDIEIENPRKEYSELENEVIRVVKKSPKWTPAKHKGEFVNIKYTMPVIFKLQD